MQYTIITVEILPSQMLKKYDVKEEERYDFTIIIVLFSPYAHKWRQISIEHLSDVKGEHMRYMIFLLSLPLPQGTFCFFQLLLLSEMLSKAAIKTGRSSIEEKEIEKMENFQDGSKWNVYMRKSLGYLFLGEKFLIRNKFTPGMGIG